MRLQTCRRHPSAGPFMAECSGCKRELFDLQARNEAEAKRYQDARAALAVIGTDPAARIVSVTQVGTALVIATEQSGYFEFCVDTFRPPTVAETDPELTDWARRDPGEWVLMDQDGRHGADEVDDMVSNAIEYLAMRGIVNEPAA
jgi:hypothetical protein